MYQRTIIYAPTGVCAIFQDTVGSPSNLYYIHTDYLGSWLTITNSAGVVTNSYSYDAWGRPRNPKTWHADSIPVNSAFTSFNAWQPRFDYGYTGQEQMAGFGLINYNARLYDPYSQRFMNPDPDVQDPSNAQNLNRYSYCLNNPLRYTDPTGEDALDCGGDKYKSVPCSKISNDRQKEPLLEKVGKSLTAVGKALSGLVSSVGKALSGLGSSGGSPSGGGGSTIPDNGGGPKTSSQNSTTANNPYSNTNVNSGGNIGLVGDGEIKRDYRKDWSITDNYDDYKSKDLDIDDNEAGNSFNSCVPACLALISRSFGNRNQDQDFWIEKYCSQAKQNKFTGANIGITIKALNACRYNCALIKTKPGGSMLDIINQAGVAILNRKNRLVITLSNYKSLDGENSGSHMMVIKEIRVTKDGNWDMELMNPEKGINYFINRDEFEGLGVGYIYKISKK